MGAKRLRFIDAHLAQYPRRVAIGQQDEPSVAQYKPLAFRPALVAKVGAGREENALLIQAVALQRRHNGGRGRLLKHEGFAPRAVAGPEVKCLKVVSYRPGAAATGRMFRNASLSQVGRKKTRGC